MANYDAGAARAIYDLSIDHFESSIQRAKQLYAELETAQQRATQPASLPGLGGTGGAGGGGGRAASFAAEQRAQAALEAQQARLARAQGDGARAAELEAAAQDRLRAALVRTDTTTAQAIALQRQLTSVETQTTRAQQQAGASQEAFIGGLLRFTAPAAAASLAVGALVRTAQSFHDAFVFKAQLDEQTRSVQSQLQGIRDSGQTFAEAQRFADRYKLTQEETTTAIRESLPVLRESRASTEQTLSVLSRLRVRNPLEDVAGAARAVSELQAGQVLSLVNRFNLPRAEINKLNAEIKNGGDAVLLLDKYLNTLGLTEATLTAQTQGASGALRDQARAQEQVRLAQARIAESAGAVALVQEQARVYQGLANVLNGQIVITEDSRRAFEKYSAIVQAVSGNGAALIRITQEEAAAQIQARDATAQHAAAVALQIVADLQAAQAAAARATAEDEIRQQRHLDIQATQQQQQAIAQLTAGLGEQAAKHALAAQQAALLKQREDGITSTLAQLTNGTITQAHAESILANHYDVSKGTLPGLIALTLQLAGARRASLKDDLAAQTTPQIRNAQNDFQRELRQRKLDIADEHNTRARAALQAADAARREQILTTGTLQQRLRLRQAEFDQAVKLHGAESAEAISAQTDLKQVKEQIAKADDRAGKERIKDTNQALSLEERIRDSKESQLKASVDARKLDAQDRLDRLKEDQDLAQARRVLEHASDPRFRAAAQARIDLINAQRDERALALQQAQATAGGTIVNGRVFQSIPGAGAPPIPPLPTGAPASSPTRTPPSPATSGAMTIQFLVDGHLIAQEIIPDVLNTLAAGQQQHAAAGGGR